MPIFDSQSAARVLVYTYKEGVLSPFAHDLCLKCVDFEIDVDLDKGHASGRFSTAGLRVVGAVRNGTVDESILSDKQKKDIETNVQREVLESERFPDIRFIGNRLETQDPGFRIDGVLMLNGRRKDIHVVTWPDKDFQKLRLTLHQPEFGIKPFRALLGSLRIKAEIDVEIHVPFGEGHP